MVRGGTVDMTGIIVARKAGTVRWLRQMDDDDSSRQAASQPARQTDMALLPTVHTQIPTVIIERMGWRGSAVGSDGTVL